MILLLFIVGIAGVVVWYVNTYVPMQPAFKMAFNILAVVLLLLYVLDALGVVHVPLKA